MDKFLTKIYKELNETNKILENNIKTLFNGRLENITTCMEPRHVLNKESTRSEKFKELVLNIKPQLEESLKEHFQIVELNGSNQYKCEKCPQLVNAERKLQLVELPAILIILLKRVNFNK